MLKFLQREHRKKHKIDSDKVDQNQTIDFMHRSLKQEQMGKGPGRMLDESELEIEHVENQTLMLDQSDLAAF